MFCDADIKIEKLQIARLYRGFVLETLSAILNITAGTLCKYEKGRLNVKPSFIKTLAQRLNIDERFFYHTEITIGQADLNINKIENIQDANDARYSIQQICEMFDEIKKYIKHKPLIDFFEKNPVYMKLLTLHVKHHDLITKTINRGLNKDWNKKNPKKAAVASVPATNMQYNAMPGEANELRLSHIRIKKISNALLKDDYYFNLLYPGYAVIKESKKDNSNLLFVVTDRVPEHDGLAFTGFDNKLYREQIFSWDDKIKIEQSYNDSYETKFYRAEMVRVFGILCGVF